MRYLLLAVLTGIPFSAAVAEPWCSTSASAFSFETTFEGERLPGEFRRFDVRFNSRPDNPQAATLNVSVDLLAADMGDPDMNAVLADPAWFHSERFAEAIFSSDTMIVRAPGEFVATGTLELKGNAKPVSVPFTWEQSEELARLRGATTLQRTDFDVGTGEWSSGDSIGLEVRLTFDVQLERCE
jgi:polyisoprenoid-binding protein YceI